jgi:hypothetical protein
MQLAFYDSGRGTDMANLKPLGVFGEREYQKKWGPEVAEELRRIVGEIPKSERTRISSYLSSGTPILALMGYSSDILDGKFEMAGGMGIMSDGVYFWRQDAAKYVEFYGTALDPQFLTRAEDLNWTAPVITQQEVIELDRYLFAYFNGRVIG